MSLDPEQIDAYTIAIEQELMDEEFVSSQYTDLISDAIENLDSDDRQAELLKIAADIGLLFSGVLLKNKEEAEAKRREKIRLEQERVDRENRERDERRRFREQGRMEERARLREERIARGEDPDQCFCGVPGCTYSRYAEQVNRLTQAPSSATYGEIVPVDGDGRAL